MTLPESIQQQAEYAEALGQKFAGVSNKDVVEQTQQTEGQPKAEEPKQEEAEANEMEKLRNRYSSLQGKYNAEVPRLSARNQELESELRQLMEENKRLRDEAAKKEASAGYLTENDASEFGSDMVDLVRRGAKEELKPYSQATTRLMSEVEELKNQLRMTQQQAAAGGAHSIPVQKPIVYQRLFIPGVFTLILVLQDQIINVVVRRLQAAEGPVGLPVRRLQGGIYFLVVLVELFP